jgi:hypothetical protein
MHTDRVSSRKTPPGAPVVHGVHTLLLALESLVAEGIQTTPLYRVRARFLRWVYLDEEAVVLIEDAVDGAPPQRLQIAVNGVPVCSVELSYGEPQASSSSPTGIGVVEPRLAAARNLGLMQMEGRHGCVGTASFDDTERMFPALCSTVGAAAVAQLAACSYVVGMEAPGLHSMFSKLDVEFMKPVSDAVKSGLRYEVAGVDDRFRKLRVKVEGSAITGTLDAFVRMPPVKQVSMQDASAAVRADEFAALRTLVIGGSRGLGEATAKLLAAGGARVAITYVAGRDDAEAVAAEIRAHGGEAHTLAYDVLKGAATQLQQLAWVPTQLFYFATPTIARAKAGVFSSALFAEFAQYYLAGFHELCVALLAMRSGANEREKLKVLYPSTVFVESRPLGMTEYAMVKAAGEALCVDMNVGLAGIEVLAPRLPKLPTDQTAGVLPEREANAVEVLLPLLRQMQGTQ